MWNVWVREHVSFFYAYLLTKCLSIFSSSSFFSSWYWQVKWKMSKRNERLRFNLYSMLKKLAIADIDAGGSGKLNTSINILLVQVFRIVRSYMLFMHFVDITHLSSEDWWWWWYLPLPLSVISHTIDELLLISFLCWLVFYLELYINLFSISNNDLNLYFECISLVLYSEHCPLTSCL